MNYFTTSQSGPISGAKMLLLIRNGVANGLRQPVSASLALIRAITPRPTSVRSWRSSRATAWSRGRPMITSRWPIFGRGFNRHSTSVCAAQPRSHQGTIVARPFFGVPVAPAEPHDVFVVMPFREDLRPVWEDHIRNAVTTVGLTVARADDFFTADSVVADVWNAIFSASAIIADCTGRNPNVFYEIGVAHVLGRPVVLITQSSDDVPFDLRHIRFIEYEYTPRGMELFEQRLAETLRTATKA